MAISTHQDPWDDPDSPGWVTYPIVPNGDKEMRDCFLMATNQNALQREYQTAEETLEDPAVWGVWHGTDCAVSLWLAIHNDRYLDNNLPQCQRLAAGGSFRSRNLYAEARRLAADLAGGDLREEVPATAPDGSS